MNSLRHLEFSSSKGFNSLFLTLKHDPNLIGKPVEGFPYVGFASRSCDESSIPFLDVQFPDLISYSGCVLVNDIKTSEKQINDSKITLSGQIMHLKAGIFRKQITDFNRGLDFIGTAHVCGTLVPCSHRAPEDSEALASLAKIQNQPPTFSVEQQKELDQNLQIFNAIFEQQALNNYDQTEVSYENPNEDPTEDPGKDPDR